MQRQNKTSSAFIVFVTLLLTIGSVASPGQRFVDSPKVGEFLIESFFELGTRDTWNNILKMATGEKLQPKYFVRHALE